MKSGTERRPFLRGVSSFEYPERALAPLGNKGGKRVLNNTLLKLNGDGGS